MPETTRALRDEERFGAALRAPAATLGGRLARCDPPVTMRDDGTPSDPTIRRLLILICVLGVLGATYVASCLDAGRTTTTEDEAA